MSTPPPRRARLDSNPFERRGNGFFLFMVVVVIGIGAAYGIAARRGLYPIAATKTFIGLVREWTGNGSAAQLSATEPSVPKVEAPTPAKVEAPTPPAKTNPEPVVAAAAPKAVTPDSLPPAGTSRPAAPSEPEPAAETKAAKTTVKAIQKTSAPPPAKAERPEPPVAAAPAPKPEPPAPPPPAAAPAAQAPEPTGLAGAIKKAAGPIETAPKPQAVETEQRPAPIRGDIPETPPQGAIQGAIGMQRGAARACVEGHDAPSRATIVFESSGKVQNVSVSGPAAGTDAGRCIVRALSRASVGPFRRPSFSVSTTISPP